MFTQAAHQNCWNVSKCSSERSVLELVVNLSETGFIIQQPNPSGCFVFSTMSLHQDFLTSSKLREEEMWLKAQATQLQSYLVFHTLDLKKVMFVRPCIFVDWLTVLYGKGTE